MNFNYEFHASFRFEIFYALQLITDDTSKIHNEWKQKTISELPYSFHDTMNKYGINSTIWIILSDLIETSTIDNDINKLLKAIKALPASKVQKNVLKGVLHYPNIVEEIIESKIDIETAIKKIPKKKYEWLAYVGLYPYSKSAPINVILELLIDNTEKFKDIIINLLTIFWDMSFEKTWKDLALKLDELVSEKSRLYEVCSLSEFAKNTLLPLEVDEKNKQIKALRGGFIMPFDSVSKLVFMPSAFNYKKLWTCYELENNEIIAYFPYFEPRISLTCINEISLQEEMLNNLDPALIFKALGDVTRFAIVSIIAKDAKSSVELSKILSITKATVSHHVHILRESGLIDENYLSGSVKLNLKREVIEKISEITLSKLYRNRKI